MNQSEFLPCMSMAKKLIDDASPYLLHIGMKRFYDNYDKYKDEVFGEYDPQQRNSPSFKSFVWYMMALVRLLKQYEEKEDVKKLKLPENVVNLNEYRTRRRL